MRHSQRTSSAAEVNVESCFADLVFASGVLHLLSGVKQWHSRNGWAASGMLPSARRAPPRYLGALLPIELRVSNAFRVVE